MVFGMYARQLRERHRRVSNRYSIRQIALRVGMEPAYLSRIERGDTPPPSEQAIRRLAAELGEDPDFLLGLAGKIASDVCEIITKRPILFAELIRCLSDFSDEQLMTLVIKIRNNEC